MRGREYEGQGVWGCRSDGALRGMGILGLESIS